MYSSGRGLCTAVGGVTGLYVINTIVNLFCGLYAVQFL